MVRQRVSDGASPGLRAGGIVNWRSVGLGLIGVVFICGLTPFNDYALNNTYLVGSFLPVGLVLFISLFLLFVNAALGKVAPRHAFTGGEMAVVVAMMLVSSTLPSSGLMRYLPMSLVGMQYHGASNTNTRLVLERAGLPEWALPDFGSESVMERGNSDVVRQYVDRVPPDENGAIPLSAIPWAAWIRPALAWGALLTCLYGALLCLTFIVRRQWAENERLAFPLATVYQSLIEPPEPGRLLNPLLRSRSFWITAAVVFCLHAVGALHKYQPTLIPELTLSYRFDQLLTEPPFGRLEGGVKGSTVYFVIIGITFLLQTKLAFSVWFFYILHNLVLISWPGDIPAAARLDQSFGAALCFAAMVIWIGRHHWMLVLRQMWRGERDGEACGGYLSYRFAGWGLVACLTGMSCWFWAAGMTLPIAVAVTLLVILFITIIARVVCETGLPLLQLPAMMTRPWNYAVLLPATPIYDTPRNVVMTQWMSQMFVHDMRESLMGYSTTAARTADGVAFNGSPHRRTGRWIVAAMALALVVGYFVAGASTLWTEYNYGATLSTRGDSPLNNYGLTSTQNVVMAPAYNLLEPNRPPAEAHNQIGHFTAGVVLTGALSVMRMIFAWWPLHPIGYLICYTYPVSRIWFSVFIGWLIKLLIVKFGGAAMIKSAKPVFLGMIIGEVLAAGFWLLVSLVMVSLGFEYQKVSLLPE